jgi:2-phosphoglycerate kinase
MSREDSFFKNAKESLGHVYWIGGATTAGKSTIAERMADEFGLVRYDADSKLREHMSRATEKEHPALYAANEAWTAFR